MTANDNQQKEIINKMKHELMGKTDNELKEIQKNLEWNIGFYTHKVNKKMQKIQMFQNEIGGMVLQTMAINEMLEHNEAVKNSIEKMKET